MQSVLRSSGFRFIDEKLWGSHLCQLYWDPDDLFEVVVPYFAAGIAENELCFWALDGAVGVNEAEEALRKAVPDLNERIRSGQVVIARLRDLVPDQDTLTVDKIDAVRQRMKEAAVEGGFSGLRASADISSYREDTYAYDRSAHRILSGTHYLLCTFCLKGMTECDIVEVVNNHQQTIIRRNGDWSLLQNQESIYAHRQLAENIAKLEVLSRALETSTNGVMITDANGSIVWMNATLSSTIPQPVEDVLGKDAFEVVSIDFITEEMKKEIVETVSAGQVWRGEGPDRRIDGTMRFQEVIIIPVRNNGRDENHDGAGPAEITHFVAIERDVSDRHSAELALIESEQRYHNLFEFASDAIFLMRDGVFLECNRRALEILGRSQEEVIGKTAPDFSPEFQANGVPSQEASKQYRAAALSGSPQSFPWLFLRPDGTQVEVEVGLSRFESGEGYMVQALVRDVTERNRAQRAERERSKLAEVLRATAEELSSTLSTYEVMRRILKAVGRVVPCYSANIVLNTTDKPGMILLDTEDDIQGELDWLPPPDHFPNYQKMERTRYPLLIPDTLTDPDWVFTEPFKWIRSYLGAPLVNQGKVIGFLNLNSDVPGFFQPHHVDHLYIFSNQASMALENARLFEETQKRAQEMELIARFSSILRSGLSKDSLLSLILEQVTTLFHTGGALLAIADPQTGEMIVAKGVGAAAHLTGTRLSREAGLSCHPADDNRAHTLDNVSAVFQETWMGGKAPQSAACIPLNASEGITGQLWAVRDEPFSSDDLRLLNTIGDMAVSALNRAALFEHTLKTARNLEIINQTGREISETFDLATIYDRMGYAISALWPDLAAAFISLYDDQAQTFTCVYGLKAGSIVDVSRLPVFPLTPDGTGMHSRVIRTKETLLINDLSSQPVIRISVGNTECFSQSALFVPMLSKGSVMGIIQLQSYHKGAFTDADVDLLKLLGNTASIAIENARLFIETQQRIQHLAALHAIDEAINSSLDLDLVLKVILEEVMGQLNVDAAGILLYDPCSQRLNYAAGRGFRHDSYAQSSPHINEGFAGQAASARMLLIRNLSAQEMRIARPRVIEDEGFTGYAAIPLIAKNQLKGIIEVFFRRPMNINEDWKTFFHALADQAAIAVDNASMFADLQRSHDELAEAYDTTLMGWMRTLELRDHETEGHTQRVANWTVALARSMGLPENEIIQIRRGAMLHDIGKMGIPDNILHKPGPLTEEEWKIMRQHPTLAYRLLKPIAYLQNALEIPYCHHERWDGKGYPRGLKGTSIPLAARLFSIVDVWDALTSDRPYRKAWPTDRVRDYLLKQSGKRFDPAIVDLFMKTLADQAVF